MRPVELSLQQDDGQEQGHAHGLDIPFGRVEEMDVELLLVLPVLEQHEQQGREIHDERHALGHIRIEESRGILRQIAEEVGYAVAAEDDVAKRHEGEHLQNAQVAVGGVLLQGLGFLKVLSPLRHQVVEDEAAAMIESEEDERPVGSVPGANGKEVDHHGQVEPPHAEVAELEVERCEHIVGEPAGERDVPPLPILRDVDGEERQAEVLQASDAQYASHADGHVGIAREVGVELERVEHGGDGERGGVVVGVVVEHGVGVAAYHVGHAHLLEHAPEDALAAFGHVGHAELVRRAQLLQEGLGAVDGAGEYGGEEGHVGGEADEVALRVHLLAVYLHEVADELECEEADAYGQDNLEGVVADVESHRGEQVLERLDEEVEILEIEQQQDAQPHANVGEARRLSGGRVPVALDALTYIIGDDGAHQEDGNGLPVGVGVEKV